MSTSNACVVSQYFSGQGAFLLGERDPITGVPLGLLPVGNVSALSLAVETTLFEHKESCTGVRGIDLTLAQEINATLTVTLESLEKDNLALAVFGTASAIVAASVVDVNYTAYHDKWTPLAHIDIDALEITNVGDTVTYVEGTDYICNNKAGAFMALSTGAIADLQILEIDYDYADQDDVQALLTSTGAIRYARFEGLNTARDPNSVFNVNVFRVQTQPLAELALITDEIAQMEVEFKILVDTLSTSTSDFFEIRKSDGG